MPQWELPSDAQKFYREYAAVLFMEAAAGAFPSQVSGFLVTCFKRAVTKGKHTLSIHFILYKIYNIIDKTTNQQLQIKIFVGCD